MPAKSHSQRLREAEEAVAGRARYRDVALALRRAKSKETLLFAGGKWDFFERRFVSLNPQDQVGVIYLEESQVAFTEWFAGFLHDYREGYPRDISLALAAGDRRAGKTFAAYFCQIAALIDVPRLRHDTPTIGWTVSKTYRERAELNDLILNLIPDNFYKHKGTPEHRYDFVHGPVLRNLSADDPDSLKQGRVDFLLYNEPQKMQARAIVHGLYGTADKAGLAILAANRPSEHDTQGEWLYDLKEAVDEEIIAQAKDQNRTTLGAVFFGFSSRENTKIDQPARKRVARLAAVIDKAQAEADDAEGAGDWKKPGERASKEFKRHRHVVPLPDAGARDCTAQVASERGTWGDWSVVAGADFQDKSWAIAGVVAKLLGDPADPTIHFCDEHYNNSDERLYLETFEDRFAAPRGYEKHNVLWIGDASGSWQTAKHEEGERLVADAANGTSLAPFDVLVERHPTRPFEVIEWRPPDGVAAADILELTEEGEARMAAREAQGCVIYQTRAMSSEELALAEAEDHARRNPELPLAAAAEEETGATPAAENDATPAPAKRSSVTTQCPTVRTEGLTPLLDVLCDGTGAPRRKGFCPACHAELTDAKKVGFIARRRERQRLQEEADRQLAAQAEDADDSNHGDGDGDDDEATIQ